MLGKLFKNKIAISSNSLLDVAFIPEPTRSLLFITDEPLSKYKDSSTITISIGFNGDEDSEDIYSEPSLIWTKLPVEKNSQIETAKMYYPSYAKLDSKCRFQYLNWLKDVSKETNLSYVFLYYYGLERHLLVGNYDLAVDEIVKLTKYHDKGSFKSYASTALLAASVYRKRPDILDRAPFTLEVLSNIGLFLRWQIQKDLNPKEIMNLANKVGFKKKTYIKRVPDLFLKELQKNIQIYTKKHGLILESLNFNNIKKADDLYFANTSIPSNVRTISTPQILENEEFQKTVFNLLNQTHEMVKSAKK